jgi:hypothetical protein
MKQAEVQKNFKHDEPYDASGCKNSIHMLAHVMVLGPSAVRYLLPLAWMKPHQIDSIHHMQGFLDDAERAQLLALFCYDYSTATISKCGTMLRAPRREVDWTLRPAPPRPLVPSCSASHCPGQLYYCYAAALSRTARWHRREREVGRGS